MPTHIPLSPKVKAILEQAAAAEGISFEELVYQSSKPSLNADRSQDTLFSDKAVWEGDVPADFSESHDDYLYGEDV